MKIIWLTFIKSYVSLGLFFYFKKIHVFDVAHIPKKQPVLLLSNHQNALLDALIIAVKCDRFAYFLTRAAVFNKPVITAVLKSLQMLPVYRIRDGWSNLSNNNVIFETCSKLLNNNETVVIFPEGNHNLKRTVRPLSKGFTRIIMDTLEKYPNINLQLVPVGLNFRNPSKFPDECAIYFGEPIQAKDYMVKNRNNGVAELKTKVQFEISNLTTHIPNDDYKNKLERLEALRVDFLDPHRVNQCLASNFVNCTVGKKNSLSTLSKIFKFLLICNTLPPYLIWKFIAEPKVKEKEFLSTFRFAMAITIFPLYLLIVFMVLGSIVGFGAILPYIVFVLLLALGTIKL
ncbi:1-acyl-sn-glycerol-3-phosphate acyltransferase [Algibacter mikhailovii]|uniref:Phospholipid/glycerol acyltransferase domain-containing protein n=1 Tax=Algibacter mikhailovii TaxID=425498 RepID=A0A918VAC1_9FLAO|nr:1-acyl-sn-glycerol-3-phosphate acyltransferase [Algibacter mikhailovii]GGZ80839.1 hypothetical protein GCM10007028_17750 [Algibacter mikhailovii]